MKKIVLLLFLVAFSVFSVAQVNDEKLNTCNSSKNNWGAKLKASNIHLGLDIQTKYLWRGMEMMSDESAPLLFPCVN